jgi:hypothetical protein
MTYENCLETRNQTLGRLFDTTVIGVSDLAGDTMGSDGRHLSAVLQELPVCDLQQELDNVCNNQPYRNSSSFSSLCSVLAFAHLPLIWCFVCLTMNSDGIGYRLGFHHLHRGCQSISIGPSMVRPVFLDAAHPGYRFPIRHTRGRHHVHCGPQDFPTCA